MSIANVCASAEGRTPGSGRTSRSIRATSPQSRSRDATGSTTVECGRRGLSILASSPQRCTALHGARAGRRGRLGAGDSGGGFALYGTGAERSSFAEAGSARARASPLLPRMNASPSLEDKCPSFHSSVCSMAMFMNPSREASTPAAPESGAKRAGGGATASASSDLAIPLGRCAQPGPSPQSARMLLGINWTKGGMRTPYAPRDQPVPQCRSVGANRGPRLAILTAERGPRPELDDDAAADDVLEEVGRRALCWGGVCHSCLVQRGLRAGAGSRAPAIGRQSRACLPFAEHSRPQQAARLQRQGPEARRAEQELPARPGQSSRLSMAAAAASGAGEPGATDGSQAGRRRRRASYSAAILNNAAAAVQAAGAAMAKVDQAAAEAAKGKKAKKSGKWFNLANTVSPRGAKRRRPSWLAWLAAIPARVQLLARRAGEGFAWPACDQQGGTGRTSARRARRFEARCPKRKSASRRTALTLT